MFDISGKKYKIPRYQRAIRGKGAYRGGAFLDRYNVYDITTRYTSRITEAMAKKLKEDAWLSWWMSSVKGKLTIDLLHARKMHKIKEGKLYDRFQARLFQYIKDNRAVTFHELCRHFSGKRSDEIQYELALQFGYRGGMIIGLLRKKVAFYIGKDIPIIQTIDRLRVISKKKGHNDLKHVAQVLEMFSAGLDISRQLYELSGLRLEERDKSWTVTAEGTRVTREWPEGWHPYVAK